MKPCWPKSQSFFKLWACALENMPTVISKANKNSFLHFLLFLNGYYWIERILPSKSTFAVTVCKPLHQMNFYLEILFELKYKNPYQNK